MKFNPILSLFRFLIIFISGKIISPKMMINKTITVYGTDFLVFRHIAIEKDNSKELPAVLVLQFKFEGTTLERNRVFSLFQIPFFVGLPGFQEKLWTYNEKYKLFQGIYQWESVEHTKSYLSSFACNYINKKAVKGSVVHKVFRGLSLDMFLEENCRIENNKGNCDG